MVIRDVLLPISHDQGFPPPPPVSPLVSPSSSKEAAETSVGLMPGLGSLAPLLFQKPVLNLQGLSPDTDILNARHPKQKSSHCYSASG